MSDQIITDNQVFTNNVSISGGVQANNILITNGLSSISAIDIVSHMNSNDNFKIQNITDPANPAVNSLIIRPTNNASRLYFGSSGHTWYSLNLQYVYSFENFPSYIFPASDFTIFMAFNSNLYFRHYPMYGSKIYPVITAEESVNVGYFNFSSNMLDSTSARGFVFDTKYTRTGGNIFEVYNYNTPIFNIDYSGTLSASNIIYASLGGNSVEWGSAYNTVNSNSAIWGVGGSGDPQVNSFVYSNSANILETDTVVQVNSSIWGAGSPTTSVDYQIFTGNGTWTKPTNAKIVNVICIGGGGGGGSGRVGAASSNRYGGGGGAGGGYTIATFSTSALNASEVITIGAGGTGGTSVTGTNNGNNGTAGGDTIFGDYLQAKGGNSGSGGTTAAGTAGAITNYTVGTLPNIDQSTAAGAAGAAGNASNVATQDRYIRPTGGGGGGGISSANARGVGSTGGSIIANSLPVSISGGSGGNPVGNPGGNGNSFSNTIGTGGGGGSAGSTDGLTNGFNGGNGGMFGAGGGGGGAATDPASSGAGGNGYNGVCIVITFCSS